MKFLPLLIGVSSVLAGCLATSEPAPFLKNSVSELPYRLKGRTYPAIRRGVRYQATATYHYDSLNRLVRQDSSWTDRTILYRYIGNRVVGRLTVSVANGAVFFRDTLIYTSTGQLLSSQQTANGSTSEYLYRYDKQGQLTEIITQALTYDYYYRRATYSWQNGNITNVTFWNRKGEKQSEWSYQYDNQANPLALLPASPNPDDPFALCRNNVVVSNLDRDYTGLIDLIANPVRITFTYNSTGLPTEKRFNYDDRTEVFTYESKQ